MEGQAMQPDPVRENLQHHLWKRGIPLAAASTALEQPKALEATPDARRDAGWNSGAPILPERNRAPASDVGKASGPKRIEHDLGL